MSGLITKKLWWFYFWITSINSLYKEWSYALRRISSESRSDNLKITTEGTLKETKSVDEHISATISLKQMLVIDDIVQIFDIYSRRHRLFLMIVSKILYIQKGIADIMKDAECWTHDTPTEKLKKIIFCVNVFLFWRPSFEVRVRITNIIQIVVTSWKTLIEHIWHRKYIKR